MKRIIMAVLVSLVASVGFAAGNGHQPPPGHGGHHGGHHGHHQGHHHGHHHGGHHGGHHHG